MVSFWVPNMVRHLIFRVPKRDQNFDNHPCKQTLKLQPGFLKLQFLKPNKALKGMVGLRGRGLRVFFRAPFWVRTKCTKRVEGLGFTLLPENCKYRGPAGTKMEVPGLRSALRNIGP